MKGKRCRLKVSGDDRSVLETVLTSDVERTALLKEEVGTDGRLQTSCLWLLFIILSSPSGRLDGGHRRGGNRSCESCSWWRYQHSYWCI